MTQRIGPFEIVRELGRGGMGVVSLGRDTRLGRDVAIKALPAEMAADPVRLERFEREARLLAGLNHPNVAGIHGVEEQDGHRYLILEFVDGESLADRLDRGPLPVDEAIEVAIQIAAGVEAAHEAGVVHRDLKPGNIMVTPDGAVKVLDFGLARADEPMGSSSGGGFSGTGSSGSGASQAETMPQMSPRPTPTHAPTIEGSILGTAAYMSPEQARGRRVDKRTDIWSFGVVLYELLVGASPFRGETVSDSIGAVLHKDPDLAELPPDTPPRVRRVLERCLDRDRSLRYRDIGDARLDLLRPEPETTLPSGSSGSPTRFGPVAVIAAATITLATVAGLTWALKPAAAPPDPAALAAAAPPAPAPFMVQTDVSLPDGERLAHAFLPNLAISPDGRTLAFTAGAPSGEGMTRIQFPGTLMIRRLGDPEPVPVAGAATDSTRQPVFSPDGTRLAYVRYEESQAFIEVIPVTGGRPTRLADVPPSILGLSWTDDGRILFGSFGGLRSVPAAGGPISELTSTDLTNGGGGGAHTFPHALPGGRGTLYSVQPLSRDVSQVTISVRDAETGDSRVLLQGAGNAQYAGGRLVFARDGELHAARFDLATLMLLEDPRPLGMPLVQSTAGPNTFLQNAGGQFAVSPAGTLAFAPGPEWPEFPATVGWIDRTGAFEAIDLEPREYAAPRADPSGRRLLIPTFRSASSAIWVHDLRRDLTQPAHRGAEVLWAAWGPGPDEITINDSVDGRTRVVIRSVRGTGTLRVIDPPEGTATTLISEWSRDRRHLLAVRVTSGGGQGLAVWNEDTGWTELPSSPGTIEVWPSFSPDGRWIAYSAAGAQDRYQVFIRPFGREGGAELVTDGSSVSPVWSPDGTELYYQAFLEADEVPATDPPATPEDVSDDDDDAPAPQRWAMAVSITETADGVEIGRPQPLFRTDHLNFTIPVRAWDVGPDGRFLVATKPAADDIEVAIADFFPDRIRVVQHWAASLDAAAGE